MKKVIGELTRPQFQTASRLVSTLKKYAGAKQELEFICLDAQTPAIENPELRVHSLPSGTHFADIAEFVWRQHLQPFLNTCSADDQLTIVTNHKVIFELVTRIPPDKQQRVFITSWSRVYQSLPTEVRLEINNDARSIPSLDGLIEEEDLIKIVSDALRIAHADEPGKAIRQTELRQFLIACDERFKKQNPQASAPGLIAEIVRVAVRRGIVEVNSAIDPANPLIWLNTRSTTTKQISTRPDEGANEGPKSRSKQFIELLSQTGFGPFSKVRQQVYDKFEELVRNSVESGIPLKLSQLITQAIGRTKVDAERTNRVSPRYPWRHLRGLLISLLSRRPVLLDEKQQSISTGFASLGSKVAGLTPDWRLALEGELIIALVEGGADLKLHDLNPIAGALYLDRSEEAENRVGEVIDYLLSKQLLREGADHALELVERAIIPIVRDVSA